MKRMTKSAISPTAIKNFPVGSANQLPASATDVLPEYAPITRNSGAIP